MIVYTYPPHRPGKRTVLRNDEWGEFFATGHT